MSLTTDELIDSLRDHLGVEETDDDWTNAKCLKLLNRSYWELNNKFHFREKEGSTTIATIASTDQYSLSSVSQFEAIQSIYILFPTTSTTTKLIRTTVEDLENQFNLNTSAEKAPTHYYRRDNYIAVYPIPDNVYTLTIKYLLSLSDLALGDSPDMPQEWHEVIMYGALWRAQLQLSNHESSTAALNHQVRLMNSIVPVDTKEESDSRESGVQVYTGYGNYYNNNPSRRLWK